MRNKKPIDMDGTSNWSASVDIAYGFASKTDNRIPVMFVCRGAKMGTHVGHLGAYGNIQDEVTISKNAKWLIVDVGSVKNIVIMKLE